MENKEFYNPQNGEVINAKRPKQFWKDWRFYVYSLIAIMLAIVSFSSCLTACAAINAGVGRNGDASYSVSQRKNAAITTDGGYSGYSFSLDASFPDVGYQTYFWYTVDVSSYTLTEQTTVTEEMAIEQSDFLIDVISLYEGVTDSDDVLLFALFGSYSYDRHWLYLSFKIPTGGSHTAISCLPFVCLTSWPNVRAVNLFSGSWTNHSFNGTYYFLNTASSCTILLDSVSYASGLPSSFAFQDVVSYYQELGYQTGSSDGYGTGHSAGYNEGYASGNANGYASGYEQATQDYQTGIAFTSYGLYANAQLTLTTDEVIGNYSYMYLFKYVTSNYDEHTVYVLFTQNSSTSQYLGYVLDRNDSDDSTSAVTIGSFSAASSLSVTITAEQDQYFELYTGFVTSFFDRGSEVIEAVWFSGGTSQTALQNYQDGYDTGYQDGVSAGYGSGYDAGYRVGEVAGINQAEPEALTNTLVAVFQQPFNQIYRFFNFNIFGLNVLGLATGLLSVFIIIKVFKKVLK